MDAVKRRQFYAKSIYIAVGHMTDDQALMSYITSLATDVLLLYVFCTVPLYLIA